MPANTHTECQKKRNWAAGAGARLLSAVYPRRCPVCDGILTEQEPYLCRKCAVAVSFIRGPVCMKCGAPLREQWTGGEKSSAVTGSRDLENFPLETEELCPRCKNGTHLFVQGFAPFLYRGEIRSSLVRMKYGHRAEYAHFYGKAMAVYGKPWLDRWEPSLVVPVPVHPGRERKRGYNQAAELARELGKNIDVPVLENAVVRTKQTKPQKELTKEMRRRNLHGAFQVKAGRPLPLRILVVDDIFTTGATVDEMTRTLLRSGAREVYVACASID